MLLKQQCFECGCIGRIDVYILPGQLDTLHECLKIEESINRYKNENIVLCVSCCYNKT